MEPVDDIPDPDLKVYLAYLLKTYLTSVNIQIILLGDSAVGKSKLVERYLMDDYNPRQV